MILRNYALKTTVNNNNNNKIIICKSRVNSSRGEYKTFIDQHWGKNIVKAHWDIPGPGYKENNSL